MRHPFYLFWTLCLIVGAAVLLLTSTAGGEPAVQAQTEATLAPTLAIPAIQTLPLQDDEPPAPALLMLARAALAENLEWENITFWAGDPLGDESLYDLRLTVPIGDRFPGFEMPLLDGTQFDVEAVHTPLLLNFWASWCGPCRLELPFLLQAHHDLDAPFEVVLANGWESASDYRKFAAREFPDTLVSGRMPEDVIAALGLRAIPISVLLGADQQVLAVHAGNLTGAVLDLFYALALASEQSTGSQPTPPGEVPESRDLAALAVLVDQANQAESASTVWAGGMLGLQESLHLEIAVGEKLPAFGLPRRDGEPFELDLVGQPVLVNFWASWCGPCVEEFPLLIEADRAAMPYEVVFVNIWDDPYSAEAFLADYSSDIRVLIDSTGAIPQMYHLDFVPVTLLVDGSGIVRLIQRGPVNAAVLDFAAALLD